MPIAVEGRMHLRHNLALLSILGTQVPDDVETTHRLDRLVRHVENSFLELWLSLEMFDQARDEDAHYKQFRYEQMRDRQRKSSEFGVRSSPPWSSDYVDTEMGQRERALSEGKLPAGLHRAQIEMHAKMFVMALWQIREAIRLMATLWISDGLRASLAEFDIQFANLQSIRDSIVHAEDRALWQAGHKTKLAIQPSSYSSENLLLRGVYSLVVTEEKILSSVRGSNGSFSEMSIDRSSLEKAIDIIEAALESLPSKSRYRMLKPHLI